MQIVAYMSIICLLLLVIELVTNKSAGEILPR